MTNREKIKKALEEIPGFTTQWKEPSGPRGSVTPDEDVFYMTPWLALRDRTIYLAIAEYKSDPGLIWMTIDFDQYNVHTQIRWIFFSLDALVTALKPVLPLIALLSGSINNGDQFGNLVKSLLITTPSSKNSKWKSRKGWKIRVERLRKLGLTGGEI